MRYLLLFLLLGVTQVCQAQVFEPVPDDISIKVLNQIFGGLLSGGNDAFGSAIMTFNGAILAIGGILAGYTILTATMGTAHDGEMLGKQYSSMYLPIRFACGTALVLPVKAGGYCTMQMMVMWLISNGVGLADQVWSSYMTKPNVGANVAPPSTSNLQLMKVVENAFTAAVCVEAHKRQVKESPAALDFLIRYDWNVSFQDGTYFYGDQKGLTSYFSKRACGWVKLPKEIKNQVALKGASTTNTGFLGPLDNLFTSPDVSVLNDAHKVSTASMVAAVNAVAAHAVANNTTVPQNAKKYYAALQMIAETYVKNIQSVGKTLASKENDSTASAKKYGWLLAGAYHNNIILTNSQIASAMSGYPTSSANLSANGENATVDDDVQGFLVADQVLAARGAEYGSPSALRDANKEAENKKNEEIGWDGRLASVITESFTGLNIYELQNENRGVEITVAEMGTRLLIAYGTMTLLMTGFSALALIPGTAGTIGAGLQVITSMLDLPIKALAATGFACAYLLPNLPFIVWLGCIGGFFIQCIIAILVAPLWAVMHLHPSGNDLVGKGASGYMMVLGLLLRPTFLVFGFIATIVISQVMGEFLNKVYFQVFSFSQVEGTIGFFSIIGATMLYAIIAFSFLRKTLSLMHVIPDEILKWIGGGVDQLGSYAKTMGDSSHSGMAAAAGGMAAARGGMNVSERNANRISSGLQNFNDNRAAKKLEKAGESGGDKLGGDKDKKADSKSEKEGGAEGGSLSEAQSASPTNKLKGEISKSLDEGAGSEESKGKAKDALESSLRNLSPEEAVPFMEKVQQNFAAKPDVSPTKNINSAFNESLNNKFGLGTGSMIAQIGGGYHSEKASSMLKEYKDVHQGLTNKHGGEEANKMVEGANRSAWDQYKTKPTSTKNGGNLPLKHFVTKELGNLKP